MVTTPDGMPVAMVHSQNCTSDLNAWVNLFRENLESFGVKVDTNTLYGTLYNKGLRGRCRLRRTASILLFFRRTYYTL